MKKPNITQIFNGIQKIASQHSPEILTSIGIVGMVTTTILAVKATPKALRLIDEEKSKVFNQLRSEEIPGNNTDYKELTLKPIEMVKVTWECYAPVAVTCVFSIACLIGAQSVNARRTAALATAYKLSETALAEFKDAAVDVIGEDKVKEVKQKIAENKVEKVTSDENRAKVIVTGDGDTLFIDPFSNTPFQSSKNKIEAAVNELNRRMLTEMNISLSELYDELGLEHTATSDDLGWRIDKGYIDVSLSDAIVKDGKAYVVMDFLVRPKYGYDKYY